MAMILKGDAWGGFLGEGNLEDFCFKKYSSWLLM